MNEQHTVITLPGRPAGEGLILPGVVAAIDAVTTYRNRMRNRSLCVSHPPGDSEAAAVGAARDRDFKIDLIRGSVVRHPAQNVQPGKKRL